MAGCCCGNNKETTLVYACSGAANTGFLADQVARKIMKDGCGSMTCLAALGAGLSGFVESAKTASKNIVIDGCPVACGKKIFDELGLPYKHFKTTDYGVDKGKTEITPEIINELTIKIKGEI
ncbi:MAG: putative zinc-binding protein [Spirochaetales bacterium]|nr:putative zinc-binding protein [Spirochaetales bacterium]